MKTFTLTDTRANLPKLIDQLNEDHEEVFITRGNKKGAVLMGIEDYNSLLETHYLLESPSNREHLLQAKKDTNEGKVFEAELIDE